MDSIKESERAGQVCGLEGKGLERECAASWVSLFGGGGFGDVFVYGWVGGRAGGDGFGGLFIGD